MSADVTIEITKRFNDQQRHTGRTSPIGLMLILGRNQYDELRALCQKWNGFDLGVPPFTELTRPEFRGMKIYLIDLEDCIEIHAPADHR